jgi:hypothetical protein
MLPRTHLPPRAAGLAAAPSPLSVRASKGRIHAPLEGVPGGSHAVEPTLSALREGGRTCVREQKKEVEEGQSLLERERAAAQHTAQQLVLTRANKQEADAVLLECWLNDVLMARPGHNGDVDLGQVRARSPSCSLSHPSSLNQAERAM